VSGPNYSTPQATNPDNSSPVPLDEIGEDSRSASVANNGWSWRRTAPKEPYQVPERVQDMQEEAHSV